MVTSSLGTASYIRYVSKDRRGRKIWRNKKLQCVLKETRRYCKLEEKTLDRTLRRTSLRKGYGLVVRLRDDDDVT